MNVLDATKLQAEIWLNGKFYVVRTGWGTSRFAVVHMENNAITNN